MRTKNKFFALSVIALSAMAITSCSQDEVVEAVSSPENPIRFHSDIVSRGEVTTAANLNEIWVYAQIQTEDDTEGEVIISGDMFKKDESSQMFTSENDYYWPKTGTVDFFAMNGDLGLPVYNAEPTQESAEEINSYIVVNNNQKKISNYSLATDVKAQKDLVIATSTGTKAENENSGVQLKFRHALSQCIIKAKCERNDGYTVIASNTAFGGIANFGSLTITPTDLKWDQFKYSNGLVCFSIEPGKTLNKNAAILNTIPFMLLPEQVDAWDNVNDKTNADVSGYMVVNVKIMKDGKQVYPTESEWTEDEVKARMSMNYGRVAIPVNIDWEPGKKYIYTVDFSDGFGYYTPLDPTKPGEPILGNPIKISSVEVEDWDETTPEIIANP